MSTKDIVVHNTDGLIAFTCSPGASINLLTSPAIIDGRPIGDTTVNAANYTVFHGIDVPDDWQSDWYTYTQAQGVQITAAGIAGQQSIAAAALAAYKAQTVARIGLPSNPLPGTMLAARLTALISVTVGGAAHQFGTDQLAELTDTMMAVGALASKTDAANYPWPAGKKVATADTPPAMVAVASPDDVLKIGWAVLWYVWDQKQYAAETIGAVLQPSITTVAQVDAIIAAMSWPTS